MGLCFEGLDIDWDPKIANKIVALESLLKLLTETSYSRNGLLKGD